MNNKKITKLTTSAIMLALAIILSFLKIYKLPLGGSITLLSMLPIVLISIKYGIKWGLCVSSAYALFQLFFDLGEIAGWGLTTATFIGCIVFDYLLPFGLLGLAGCFRKKGNMGMYAGIILVMLIRFFCHFLSGTLFFETWSPWNNAYLYSICYNGSFMLPELIFTLLGAIPLFNVPQMKKLMKLED